MAKFPGVDYLLIDSQLNEQEKMVRQTARQFVDERVIPQIRDCFRDGRFPKELIGEMGKLGFFGANCSSGRYVTKVPERWSGNWDDNLRLALMLDEAGIETNAAEVDAPEGADVPPGEWRSLTKDLLATLYSPPR